MARSNSMTYDPKTGTWTSSSSGADSTPVSNDSTDIKKTTGQSITTQTSSSSSGTSSSSSSSTSSSKANSSSSGSVSSKSNSGGNLTATTSNSNSATGSAEKKYNTIEYNILEGTLTFIPTKETIKLNAGDTVQLKGLGKYLSGLYYVQDITREITSEGYSHTATLIKTDFGNSIKASSNINNPVEQKLVSNSSQVEQKTLNQSYTVKTGDTLWSIAIKFYGDGNLYTKIVKANNLSSSQYSKIPVGTKIIIP